jgi:dolichol-phosphate mannosyltransferase
VNTVILVPTYNEAESLPRLVAGLRAVTDTPVLVVDDDSPDGTFDVASGLGCHVLRRVENKGLAASVIDGFEEARRLGFDSCIVMDADLQHPPEVVPPMLEALESNDVVVGSRYVKGGGTSGWSFWRRLVSRVASWLAFPVIPKIHDRIGGLFAFHLKVLEGVELKPKGFKIMMEVLAKARYDTVTEVPYVFVAREFGQSKLSRATMWSYVTQLIPLYWHAKMVRFALVGASGAVIMLSTVYVFKNYTGLHYMAYYAIAFWLSVSNNFLWNSLWTFSGYRAGGWNYTRYAIISGITFGINSGLVYLLTGVAGLDIILSTSIGILTAFVLNYLFSRRFVWRSSK